MGIKELFCAAGTKKTITFVAFSAAKRKFKFPLPEKLERLANQKAISNILLVFGKSVTIERKRQTDLICVIYGKVHYSNEKKGKKENKFSIIS